MLKNGTVKLTVSDLLHRSSVSYQDRNDSGRYEKESDARIQQTSAALSCGLTFSYKF